MKTVQPKHEVTHLPKEHGLHAYLALHCALFLERRGKRFVRVSGPSLASSLSLPSLPASSLSFLFFMTLSSQLTTEHLCPGRPVAPGSSDTKGAEAHFASAWRLVSVKCQEKSDPAQPDTSDHGPGLQSHSQGAHSPG